MPAVVRVVMQADVTSCASVRVLEKSEFVFVGAFPALSSSWGSGGSAPGEKMEEGG